MYKLHLEIKTHLEENMNDLWKPISAIVIKKKKVSLYNEKLPQNKLSLLWESNFLDIVIILR